LRVSCLGCALGWWDTLYCSPAHRDDGCADNDANEVGQHAAREAADRFLAEGRRVRIAIPPETDTDFNDLLLSGNSNRFKEEQHDAVA
jgi:hypothetical protein